MKNQFPKKYTLVILSLLFLFSFVKVSASKHILLEVIKVEPPKSIAYKLLAPIGGIKCVDPSGQDKDCIKGTLQDYFNTIVRLTIALAGVLAIIMIIIRGIQYMGDESIFGHTEAKDGIMKAVLGLIIALGSYALLNTIDSSLLGGGGLNVQSFDIKIKPLYNRGFDHPKQSNGESVRCAPITDKNSPCSVEKLTPIFGSENAVAMSKICNMESSGTNAQSGTDVCKPSEKPFSFGLFQVNLAANGKLAGADCVGLFDKSVSADDVIEPRYDNGYNCKVLPGKDSMYNTCKNRLLNPDTNLAIAKSLFLKYGKQPWIGDKENCSSAFK